MRKLLVPEVTAQVVTRESEVLEVVPAPLEDRGTAADAAALREQLCPNTYE